jgi:UDP-3-O-[3-hydroxymyristoyl] N-acetylglucosamine deacetylase
LLRAKQDKTSHAVAFAARSVPRCTLAREVTAEGVALHAGTRARLWLGPAAAGAGIHFRRPDLPGTAPIPALWSSVSETRLGTVISGADGARVAVIEHLMAALAGAGIDDCMVEVDGPEPPILDGDALSFLTLVDRAEAREQAGTRHALRVAKAVEVVLGDARCRLSPSARAEFFFEIDFESELIARQTYEFVFSPDSFRREIAPARTFGFLDEADGLRAAGLAHGADLSNTLVIDGARLVNEELRRFSDEFVRHKILDAIGDLKLAGAPLVGRFEGYRSSHALNNALLRKLFADPANYEAIG